MNIFAEFRDKVKNPANQNPEDLLELTDSLRDKSLPNLGISLEDKGLKQPSVWKYTADKEKLLEAIANKKKAALAKQEAKKKREEEALNKLKTPGKDYFRVFESDKYSKFDE